MMDNIRQSDIARELNVSRVTISKALRDHPDISPEMKRKVREAVEKMGYIPNQIARQLNSKKTFTIGIVVPDLENNFFSYIVDSMIDLAAEHDYHVLVTVSREKQNIEKKNIENLIGMRVDGLLVCLSQETVNFEVFNTVEKMKIPLVFFDRACENLIFSRVIFNDKDGAVNSLNRIIQEGYTRIAHFAGYPATSVGRERADGYRDALRENNFPVRNEWIIEGGFELKDGVESFRKLVGLEMLPEIIFAVNDRVALGAYKGAKEAGLRIPEDIGILGFGFSELTDFMDPPLTVINQDPRKIGYSAMKQLLGEIGEISHQGSTVIIEEEFLWKKSVKRKVN
jgi:LacI family transcriptional regulator